MTIWRKSRDRATRMAGGAGLLFFITTGMAAAEEFTLDIPGPVEVQEIAFACRETEDAEPARITVRYINAPANNLAVVPVEGEDRVFVRTISASGIKFVSREMVWWAKGNWAHLYDARNEEDGTGRTVCIVAR